MTPARRAAQMKGNFEMKGESNEWKPSGTICQNFEQ